jgi:hypothetical protein
MKRKKEFGLLVSVAVRKTLDTLKLSIVWSA